MHDIINQNVLRAEIRRILKEELKKEFPIGEINTIWKYLNKLREEVKVNEK